jgi:hypothetical protein
MKSNRQQQGVTKEFDHSMQRGLSYLAASLTIIALLAYVLPNIYGIDVRSLAQEKTALGVVRIALGIAIIIFAIRACIAVIKGNTLPGETWQSGLYNAIHSTFLGLNGLTILLLFIGGVTLIIWAVTEMT